MKKSNNKIKIYTEMNENKKFSISNMMLAFITVLVVIGLVALAGFFLLHCLMIL